jgi:Protein of unknown function (DUF4038)/Putative collagen-binding domain of a collagenase
MSPRRGRHRSARRRGVSAVAALATAALLGGCRPAAPPPPPPFEGSAIALDVRLLAGAARVATVVASADGGTPVALRASADGGSYQGQLVVRPGPHAVVLEARGSRGERVAAAQPAVTTSRGAAALLAATLVAPGAEPPGPVIAAVVAPLASVVAGDRLTVEARLDRGGGPISWTASPSGCGSFDSPAAASTAWTARAVGACTLSASAQGGGDAGRRAVTLLVRSRASRVEYPLRPDPTGRFLVDARGTPFLVKGESAWLALANLTEEEQETYLADRAARGFDLVEVMLMNHDYTSRPGPIPPANRYGEEPLHAPGDLSTPNDAYFDRVVRFVDRAAAHGIAVLLAPLYLGFDGGREGWWEVLRSPRNDRGTCFRFGRYVGGRLADRKNVLWLAGGDFAPPPGSEGEARHLEILRGIRDAGARQPWSGHWNVGHQGGISTDEAAFRDAMDVNGVYQYANPWKYTARAYEARPPRPVILLESTYEHEHPASNTQPFRKAWWWSMGTGAKGVLIGNLFLWMCESARGRYRAEYGDADGAVSSWAAELDSPGTREATHLHALFESLPWWRLAPAGLAGRPELVTAGRGAGQARVAAASTPEGDVLVAYVPPAGERPRTVGLDLTALRAPARLRWYDPTTGAFVQERTGIRPSRRVLVETPGRNGAGANDWVLVAEADASPAAPPGAPAARAR